MTKDHFIAQTYLKRWCDPGKKPPLQAYRKSDSKPFRCSPRDVCHEGDGDLIREYFTDPTLLGAFRKIFERPWRRIVERIDAGVASPEDKLLLSAAWAHFFLCTPAQRALVKDIYANEARALAPRLVEGHRLDPVSLNIDIEREDDFFKRYAVKHLSRATRFFYNQDWIIWRNDAETPFITSDNPSAFVPGSKPPERLLPISPSLCLRAKIDMRFPEADHFDFGSPTGSITFLRISRQQAMLINRFTVLNANDLVFSRYEDVGIAGLVKKYRGFRPQVEAVSFPTDDEALKGATLVIEPRRCE
jgi:hypothetical protein